MDIASLYRKYKESGKISTDTRQIIPGGLFFSLKGERFNANELAHEALDKGAAYAVVDEAVWAKDDRYILVDDALNTLQELARHHRRQVRIPIIALTGSNGKTTTKELIHVVLQKKYNTLATKGNLNNHIGVPLTLLSIDSTTEIAVIEMGANHTGEINMLCRIAEPTHGAITNIGSAHIGSFGGMDNIIRAKQELYLYLMNKDQSVWVNSQNPLLVKLSKSLKHPLFYPASGDYSCCELVSSDPFVNIKTEQGKVLQTHLVGEYNFENIALALCVAKFFQVSESDAIQAIEQYKPADRRSQLVIQGNNKIVLDAYNANPTSMEAAIKNLSRMKAKKKVAILGDMYELGEESDAAHTQVVDWLKQYGIEEAYLCGPLFKKIDKPEQGIQFFASRHELVQAIKNNPIHHATILIKASRGLELERVMPFF